MTGPSIGKKDGSEQAKRCEGDQEKAVSPPETKAQAMRDVAGSYHLGRPLELKYRRRTTGLVVRPWQTAWRTQVVFRTLLPLSLFFKFVVLSLMTPLLIRPRLAP
jgi:hypothetical protein